MIKILRNLECLIFENKLIYKSINKNKKIDLKKKKLNLKKLFYLNLSIQSFLVSLPF